MSSRDPGRARGFTTVEMLVGMLVGSLVIAGAYRVWKTQQVEGYRISKKADLRNQLALSAKRIQRAVTLAGIGLNGTASLGKFDAIGSDTLYVYLNVQENKTTLTANAPKYYNWIRVANPAIFYNCDFVGIKDTVGGEVRKIDRIEGTKVIMKQPFSRDYSMATTVSYPAVQQKFYTRQSSKQLILETTDGLEIVAGDLRNFQVSFLNRQGKMTESLDSVRSVAYSFTGVYPALDSALNSVVFSSTAIPRNIP